MYENIGRSLGTDYFRIADQLTDEELDATAAYEVAAAYAAERTQFGKPW
jgi:hypothetical protein